MMRSRSNKITTCAAFTALGLILGYIETFIVIPINVPGIRIGLANIITVLCLYTIGPAYTATVLFLRIALSAVLFGSPVSFAYSFTGAVAAFAGMLMMKRLGFSIYGVSFCGAILHNIFQTTVAYFMVRSIYVFSYLPVLVLWGAFAGLLIGFLADMMNRRLGNIITGG